MITIHISNKGEMFPITLSMELSPIEKEYAAFLGRLEQTTSLIMQHNFADGKDDINTPEDLASALVGLKTLTHDLYYTLGEPTMFALMKRAKRELLETPMIHGLDEGKQTVLTDILRWHLQDAIENPPPPDKPHR